MTAMEAERQTSKPTRRETESNEDTIADAYQGAIDRIDAIERLALRILNMCASVRRDLL